MRGSGSLHRLPLLTHTHARQTGSEGTLLRGSRLLQTARQRDRAREGKRADTIGLGKIEPRSPKNAAAGSADESAGASGDCIATGEKNASIHVDRATSLNNESQDKRINRGRLAFRRGDRPGPTVRHSAGGGQDVGRSPAAID